MGAGSRWGKGALAAAAVALLCAGFAVPTLGALQVQNGRVAFNGYVNDRAKVYSRTLTGSSVDQLTTAPLPSTNPTYSPDGQTIVYTQFVREDPGNPDSPIQLDLWAMDPDGSHKHPLTATPDVNEDEAAYSLDGSRIAYASSGGIWIMNPDGSDPRQVTDSEIGGQMPAFSPDGKHIVFVGPSTGSNGDGIWVIDLTTGEASQLTDVLGNEFPGPIFEMWPSYSPDGQLIAFVQFSMTPPGGVGQIYLMNPDGSDLHPITDLPINAQEPVWSTGGGQLIFDGYDGAFNMFNDPEGPYLYVVNRDGSNPHVLKEGEATEFPDWQRRLVKNDVGCSGAGHPIAGASGPNLLRGSDASDFVDAKAGNDNVLGLDGSDTVCAGAGTDTLHGGRGADTLVGESGHDGFYGDGGQDHIDARDGEIDRITCGPGTDVALLDPKDVIADITTKRPSGSCETVQRAS
jgi:Tol biopolymer transport system component